VTTAEHPLCAESSRAKKPVDNEEKPVDNSKVCSTCAVIAIVKGISARRCLWKQHGYRHRAMMQDTGSVSVRGFGAFYVADGVVVNPSLIRMVPMNRMFYILHPDVLYTSKSRIGI
jgi:hypothetical protein